MSAVAHPAVHGAAQCAEEEGRQGDERAGATGDRDRAARADEQVERVGDALPEAACWRGTSHRSQADSERARQRGCRRLHACLESPWNFAEGVSSGPLGWSADFFDQRATARGLESSVATSLLLVPGRRRQA